jgi:hypothetical protein
MQLGKKFKKINLSRRARPTTVFPMRQPLSTTEKGQQNGGGEGAPERRPDQPPLGPGGGLINRHLGRLALILLPGRLWHPLPPAEAWRLWPEDPIRAQRQSSPPSSENGTSFSVLPQSSPPNGRASSKVFYYSLFFLN